MTGRFLAAWEIRVWVSTRK